MIIRFIFAAFLLFPFCVVAEDAIEAGQKFEREKNYIEAEKLYRKAFFEGEAKGALYLYDLHKNGYVTLNDADTMKQVGLEMLKKDADNGEGGAALDLGNFYLFGDYVEGDYNKAEHYFTIAHKANKPMASYRLGMSYLEGLYNNINPHKAMYYLQIASDAGIGRASRQIAIAYHMGIGKPKNIDKAIEYYTKAAIEGEGLAMRDLANIYNNEKDNPTLHEQWLLKAVEYDISDAHYMLGKFYKSSNPEKSKKHFKAAADMKHHLSRIEIYGDY